jgi:hypothetical protein
MVVLVVMVHQEAQVVEAVVIHQALQVMVAQALQDKVIMAVMVL